MRLLSKTVPKVTGQVFQKKYIMLGRIITQWEDIVGKELAMKTQPVKLKFRKTPDKSKQFTLEIATSPAEATILQYRVDLILQKLNMVMGESMITAVRFVPVSSNSSRPVVTKRRKQPLDAQEQKYLSKTLENVEDPDIQEKLKSMGAFFLQDRKSKKQHQNEPEES